MNLVKPPSDFFNFDSLKEKNNEKDEKVNASKKIAK